MAPGAWLAALHFGSYVLNMGQDDSDDSGPLSNIPFQFPVDSEITASTDVSSIVSETAISLGETLQFVKYIKRNDALFITGVTPHGRRLTFEQTPEREGWHVVAAGRRRRPNQRELALVRASITQEMEAAMAPDGDSAVRSAYRLAASSDQPGMPVKGLQAYRDLLLDDAEAFLANQITKLAVVAIEYQAFKRFANRHGHQIGAAFVRALGERLKMLYESEPGIAAFHKLGKSFRLIVADRTSHEIRELIDPIVSDETRRWLIERVWGDEPRTYVQEVHFYVGFATAIDRDRSEGTYDALAQELNDDAYRAAKLGQLRGHASIDSAKLDERSTVLHWSRTSEEEIEELATDMDEGPAAVMAEMVEYLHELVPADLEGMNVDGDIHALIHGAIARDGFWQGTTAMRIAANALLEHFLGERPLPQDRATSVGGFDLGDEFYGISLEEEYLYFAWGDLNSAGITRVQVGLPSLRHAVGWRRKDGGGIVGAFMSAIHDSPDRELPYRVTKAVDTAQSELASQDKLRVNDAVDIADFLFTENDELVTNEHLVEGNTLTLNVPGLPRREVLISRRRSGAMLRLVIDEKEYRALVHSTPSGIQVRMRIRDTVVSPAICILKVTSRELKDALSVVREDNELSDDFIFDTVGFLRHIADILLIDYIKHPGKIGMALGQGYESARFVKTFTLEQAQEHYPGVYYEAVHQSLLAPLPPRVDRNLAELISQTMLSQFRPKS